MIVVSDTTAITSLLKINRANLLKELFGEVLMPTAVRDELSKYHAVLPEFLRAESVKDHIAVDLLREEIDAGEAEAIILAEELDADVLLIDEKDGRFIAEGRGIRCLGLAGAILVAKQNGLISNVREILETLETKANFYLDAELKRTLLRRAGELS